MVLQLALGSQPSPAGKIVTFDFQTLTFGGFSFLGTPEPDDGLRFIDASQFQSEDFMIAYGEALNNIGFNTGEIMRMSAYGLMGA